MVADLSTPLRALSLVNSEGERRWQGGGGGGGGEGRTRVIISADRANFLSTVSGR